MAAAQDTIKPPQQFVPGQRKDLYHIVQGTGRNRHWRKFGSAFVNRDGSVNVVIDLFPGAHFQLRDPNPRDTETQLELVPEPAPDKTHTVNRTKKATKGK